MTILESPPGGAQPSMTQQPRQTRQRRRPSRLAMLSWVLLAVVAFFIIYPLVGTVWDVLEPDAPPIGLGAATDTLIPVLVDTLWVVVGSVVVAMVMGVLLAWIHERTDAQLGIIGDLLPLSVLIIPQVAGVVGWVILFDPEVGYGNTALRSVFGLVGIEFESGPINIYTPAMIVLVCGVYAMPYVFLLISSALQTQDSSIEEAARTSGASPRKTFMEVTLPTLAPALGAAFIVVTIRCLTMFGIIAVIGTTAGVQTLPVYIYRLMVNFPPKTGLAVVLAGALMVLVQLLLLVQSRLVKQGRFSTIGGKGNIVRRARLGKARGPIRFATAVYLLLTAALPALAALLVSLVPYWSANIAWGSISLDSYRELFDQPTTSKAIFNSLMLAAIGATVVIAIAVMIMVPRRSARGDKVASGLTGLPAMIPHSLIGVSFIVALSGPPFNMYGTIAMLLIAYVVMELPYASQAAQAVARSVGPELVEASRVSGAGELKTFAKIQTPLMMAGLIGAWIVAFIHIVSEVTASVLLAGLNNPVIGPRLLDLVSDGTYTQVAALSSIITIVSSILVIALLVVRRRGAKKMRVG